MKKVSVIIPTHNSSKHLNECLDSVIRQTYKNLEIIIVDDASTDNSVDIVNEYKDKRIKLLKLSDNKGVSVARNKGIIASTGDYICFIDSDDYWYLNKIEKQVQFIKDKAFIYGSYEFLRRSKKHIARVPLTITYEEALKNTTIFTSTVMFNMKYLNKNNILMPDIKRGQDTACWWQVLKIVDKAYGISEPLSIYRVGEKSLSSNKFKKLSRTWNLYRRENISFLKKIVYFNCYLVNAIKRRII